MSLVNRDKIVVCDFPSLNQNLYLYIAISDIDHLIYNHHYWIKLEQSLRHRDKAKKTTFTLAIFFGK